ncbi:TPA: phage minor capsid protein [Streptococcus pneumoniae]|uniref:phage minor capsid protein n=1 Tax=Streptococcus pneumoniae TaxID=1313 RepID=UPI003878D7AE
MSKKRPPIQFNDEQLLLQASNVADIYHQLALDLFDNVVERVTERGTVYLDKQPYIWQLEKMQQMHMLNEENLKLISKYSGVAEEQLRYIVENEGLKLYTDTKQQLLEDLGRDSVVNSNHIQEILADYASQAVGDIYNLINTTLPMSVIGAYKGIVEQSVARVVTGLSTADKAISDTVMEWQEKGFQGFKDSAGRNWKIDNYARTVIKTTTYRTYREMRTRPAEELGIDTFYFSKKASARKSCAPLQHHIVTTGHARTEHGEHILALSNYGYGRPEGCLGINCGHMLTPFIPGANYKPDLGEDVASVNPDQAEENANAEAKQRALERSIRRSKEFLHVAEKLGDSELVDKYKSKVRIQQGAMRDYLKQHPFLHRDYAREKYYDDPFSKAEKEVKLRKKMAEHHYIKENEIAGFKKVGGKITKEERKVIYADENPQGLGYIGTAHSFAINKYLRDKNVMPSEYQNIVDTLDGVIKKNRTLKNIKVNRFDDEEYFNSILRKNASLLEKHDSIESALNSGQATFDNDGYTSTSYIPKYNFFQDRPIKTIINIPKNAKIYFTDNDIESEIILPKGSKYDIINMKRKGDNVIIEMNLREE